MKLALVLILILASLACAQNPAAKKGPPPKMKTMTATGTFDVKLAPQETTAKDPALGRMSIDKQFHGDLEATSQGEMLTAGTGAKGSSGAYVAIEKVTGKVRGRAGTFMLYHVGIMEHGAPSLSVSVVPDSGAGELVGITGKVNIIIDGKKHSYEFEYTLPPKS